MSFPRSLLRPRQSLSPFPSIPSLPSHPSLPTRLPGRQFHFAQIRPRPHTHNPGTSSTSALSGAGNGAASHAHGSAAGHGAAGHAGGVNGKAGGNGKKPSAHLVWYREIVPAMIPILLLSSTIFLSLTLLRTHLSHSLALSESSAKIAELEAQLDSLRKRQARQRERDRRERERILPLVVERVLQRVGAMAEEGEEEDEGEVEELPLLV